MLIAKMKRFLLVVVSVFVLVMVGIIIFIAVAGRDIPPPDTTDILVQRRLIADQDNAYTYFIAATNLLYWPTNTSLVTDILGGKTNDDAFVSNLIFKNTETLKLVDQGLIRAIKVEYRCEANTIDDLARGKFNCFSRASKTVPPVSCGKKTPAYFFQPNKTKLVLANLYRRMIIDVPRVYADMNQYDVKKMPVLKEILKENKIKISILPNGVGKILSALFVSCLDALLEQKCRMECSVAATRLILACKAYEKQHQKLPPSLEALIPKYLDAVPRDPYDGKPFRYRQSEDIVYSVGKDLQDSNGLKDLLDNAPCSWIWYAKDIIFGINNTIEPTNLPNSQ